MLKKLLVCLIIFPGISYGQSQAPDSLPPHSVLKWDLQTCLDYAQKNNIQVNNLRLAESSSQEDLLQSRAARLPGLSGSLSQSLTNSKNTNPVVGGFQTQASVAGNYTLNSSVTLYNGGYLNHDLEQKKLLVQSADLTVRQAMNDITIQIIQSYLGILMSRENITYEENLVSTSQAELAQGKQQYDVGSIARKDYVALEAQLANDNYALVTAQSAYRQNVLSLKQLLQLPWNDSLEVVVPDTLVASAMIAGLDEAQNNALQTRPEIKNGELGVRIAQLDVSKAKAGYLPLLSAGGSLSTGYSDNQSATWLRQLDNNFFQQIGLTLSVPVFTKRTVRTNVEKSEIAVKQAALSLQGTKTTLSQEVEQAYLNAVNAQSQYNAAVSELAANLETYRIATEELKAGAVNLVELLQQKNLYVQALQAYLQAKYNAVLSREIYDFYTGMPVKL